MEYQKLRDYLKNLITPKKLLTLLLSKHKDKFPATLRNLPYQYSEVG